MRSAFALRINSGRIILNFAFVALCGALQTHFHGKGRQMQRCFSCGNIRAAGITPSVIACGDATFPKGPASVVAAKFPAVPKGAPLGELANVVSLRG